MRKPSISGMLCVAMIALASQAAFAEEAITEAGINDFIAMEKKQMESRNTEGFMALFSEDYTQTSPREGTESKEQIRLKFYNTFNTAKYVLFKPVLISAEISPDGKMATVITDELTKYLVERDGKQRVITYHTAVKSTLVLVSGEIKVSSSEKIRDLE